MLDIEADPDKVERVGRWPVRRDADEAAKHFLVLLVIIGGL